MSTTQTLYHAPVFEPTVDELALLKRLEIGQSLSMSEAMHIHVSKRLYERGMISQKADGDLAITEQGMREIRRSVD